ncbi:C69 family dipeptidase [bacterium]|nr:C69 family dipeptidase [bacterium]
MTNTKYLSMLVILLLVALPVTAEEGCYSIVAGRKATADGSVLFGHNEDNNPKFVAGLRKIDRVDYKPGEQVILPGGGRIPQVPTTWAYWWLQMPELDYSDGFLNEHGVAVATDNCQSREDNPQLTDGGIGGPLLRRLVAERARTALEGVKLVGALVGQFGYTASGRTMIICDPREGWLVAMVNGKHWVAQRVPDDMVALVANTYTIREVDLADTLNFRGSPDLIDYAVKRGWYNPSDGPFSFEKAYADPKTRDNIANTHRQWSGLRRLSADTVPAPEDARLPFAVKPNTPLTVRYITTVLRDHYENTPYDPPDYVAAPAHKRHTSTICGPYTNSSGVFQLRPNMPVEIGAVWWLAMWQPCSTPYMPLYAGMERVPAELRFGGDLGLSCAFCVSSPEFGTAYSVLGDLAKWVNSDYAARIPAVRDRWRAFEQMSYDLQPPFERFVSDQWKTQPALAREMMSRYCEGIVADAVQKAQALLAVGSLDTPVQVKPSGAR